MSDETALILEIADQHDYITSLRVKNRKLEKRQEQLEQKVKFREKIIRELRHAKKLNQQVESSEASLINSLIEILLVFHGRHI